MGFYTFKWFCPHDRFCRPEFKMNVSVSCQNCLIIISMQIIDEYIWKTEYIILNKTTIHVLWWIKTIWSFATLRKCNKSKHMIIMKCAWFRDPVKNMTWKAGIITWVKFVLAIRLFQLRNVSWTVRASSYRIEWK